MQKEYAKRVVSPNSKLFEKTVVEKSTDDLLLFLFSQQTCTLTTIETSRKTRNGALFASSFCDIPIFCMETVNGKVL